VAAHHAGDAVAVGHRDPGEADLEALCHQLLRVRAAAEEGEVRRDGELREAGHGDCLPFSPLEKKANRNDNMLWNTSGTQ
jgi:hypothetical protein